MIMPKKGFTGHANDSIPYMAGQFNITGDRMQDWKTVAQQSFYDRKYS
jgi:hypothetical protein